MTDETKSGKTELIAFRMQNQEFCMNIMSVREIRGWTPATNLPHSPDYVLGMINLRGAVLPIIDLSMRLGMAKTEPDARHVIIVVQLHDKFVGLLVEAVSDILAASEDDMQPSPEVGNGTEGAFSRNILSFDNRMICLIELDSLFPNDEMIAA